jgi:arylsulfatase A-like enzyme
MAAGPHAPRAAAPALLGTLAAAALLGGAGCGPGRPNVIVVMIDTLRADRVGVLGGRRGLTPFLDSLGAAGVVFPNAYSTSSWTNPAVASLFTSRYPSQHRVTTFESRLAEAEVTLGERLRAAGWRGLGMVGNFRLTRALGFAQGFDVWFSRLLARKTTTQQLAQDTIRYYDRHVARFFWRRWKPLLLYLHPMEPHAPYDPPPDARRAVAGTPAPATSEAEAMAKVISITRWNELSPDEVACVTSLYDAEVAALDARLRRLFTRMRARGLLDHAIVVVTADHGEEFGEHGGFQHGRALYEESVRVPLIMTGPGLPAGRVVRDEVSLVDVTPTVLALLGLPPEPRFEGRSLLSRLDDDEPADVLLELPPTGSALDLRRHSAALLNVGMKVLATCSPQEGSEAFDLRTDPAEEHPDPAAIAQDAAALRARLAQRQQALATRAGTAETGVLDAATRERLRTLGYAE